MFKVKVLTVGTPKEKWLAEAIASYERRLQPKMAIDWHLEDTEQALERLLKEEPSFIALDIRGELLSSEEVSKRLFTRWGLRPCFAIGGAEGLRLRVKQRASFCWSLSPLTFTHQMARLLLIEQLYRALEIEQGTPYHK